MLAVNIFAVLIVVIFTDIDVQAQILICQDGAFLTPEGICACADGMFYNAYEGKCQNVCSYFGNYICGYYSNFECINDAEEPQVFTCQCPSGFKQVASSFETTCIDKDECANGEGTCAEANEQCVDLYGNYGCTCAPGYYRKKDGVCTEIDKCNEPGEKKCSQICKMHSDTGEYSCKCFTGYEMKGQECVLAANYQDCACGTDSTLTICAQHSNSSVYCEAKPGYQTSAVTGNVEDINECEDVTLHQCARGSECINLFGSYSCECPTDYSWNSSFNECKKKECSSGFSLYEHFCQDACGSGIGPKCSNTTVCLVENGIATCECKLACQICGRQDQEHGVNVYYISLVLPYTTFLYTFDDLYGDDKFLITKSMESIFGRGNAELTDYYGGYSGTKIRIGVGLSKPINNLEELENMILDSCWPLESYNAERKCVLPGGVIVKTDSINALGLDTNENELNNAQCYSEATCKNVKVLDQCV